MLTNCLLLIIYTNMSTYSAILKLAIVALLISMKSADDSDGFQSQLLKEISTLHQTVKLLTEKVSNVEEQLKEQDQWNKDLLNNLESHKEEFVGVHKATHTTDQNLLHSPDHTSISFNYGCTGDTIRLECPDNRTISIDGAEFGEYSNNCNSQCCAPHPNDCTEPVSDNNEADWLVLLLECQNETSCDYLFQASTFIENCTVSAVVDYMTIYYSCIPEEENPVIAFTAYSEFIREYNKDDVIIYDKTVSNIGNAYNTNSSLFLCPRHGLYQFSIFVLSNRNHTVQANIMIDGVQQVIAWADGFDEMYTHSSNSMFVICERGQKVWVASSSGQINGEMYNNPWKHSTFSGVLLRSYD